MTKEKFKELVDEYKGAESDVTKLDREFGVCIWNSYESNFYNKYNRIIDLLFEDIFGEENTNLIFEYLFEESDITFDELWDAISIKR